MGEEEEEEAWTGRRTQDDAVGVGATCDSNVRLFFFFVSRDFSSIKAVSYQHRRRCDRSCVQSLCVMITRQLVIFFFLFFFLFSFALFTPSRVMMGSGRPRVYMLAGRERGWMLRRELSSSSSSSSSATG